MSHHPDRESPLCRLAVRGSDAIQAATVVEYLIRGGRAHAPICPAVVGWTTGTDLQLAADRGTADLGIHVGTPLAIQPQVAQAADRMIKMPFASGSTWTISQGYNTNPNNGGSHYNCPDYPGVGCSPQWMYKYSFDLVRADGNTAGQPVLSPVDGTIRWIDPSYGGMSINLGNGWAVAYFHTDLAPGLAAGQ